MSNQSSDPIYDAKYALLDAASKKNGQLTVEMDDVSIKVNGQAIYAAGYDAYNTALDRLVKEDSCLDYDGKEGYKMTEEGIKAYDVMKAQHEVNPTV